MTERGMYIHSVELYGFKTFAERTRLLFSDGINAVVGPNGSGKSNVFDAIRWCVGEQSPRQLRGTRMVDFLFHGSTQRPQSAFCSVVITLANPGKVAPAPFTEMPEIAVERRLYRNGDTEYRMNGSKVRLRDVRDFWLDCAVGDYTFIEQGRVADLIQARPAQTRGFIEEAAQIVKFRKRVEESRSKFKAAQTHLDVLDAALTEEEKTVAFLRRQARKAEQYKTIHEQFGEAELTLWRARLHRLQEERNQLAQKLQKLGTEFEGVTYNIASLEGDLAADRTRITALRDQLNELRLKQASINEALQRDSTAENLASKERERLTLRLQVLKAQRETALRERVEADKLLQDSEAPFAETTAEKERLQKAFAQADQTLTQLQDTADRLTREERQYQTKLMETATELTDRNRLAQERLARRAEFEAEHTHLSTLLDAAREELLQLQKTCREVEIDLTEREAALLGWQEKREQARQQREERFAATAEIEHEIKVADQRLAETRQEELGLSAMLQDSGSEDPLHQAAVQEQLLSGKLADFVHVEDTEAERIERLFGSWLQAWVIEKNGEPRFMELAGMYPAEQQYVRASTDVASAVSELVQSNLIQASESELFLLSGSENVVQTVGALQIIGASQATGALVLRNRLQQLHRAAGEQDTQLRELQDRLLACQEEKASADAALKECDRHWRQADENKQLVAENFHVQQKKEAVAQSFLLQLEERLSRISNSLAQDGGDAEDTTLIEQLATSCKQLEQEKRTIQEDLETWHRKITDARASAGEVKIAYFAASDNLEKLERQRQEASRLLQSADIRLANMHQESLGNEERQQELLREQGAHTANIQELSAELAVLRERTDTLQSQADITEESMVEQEQKLRKRMAHRSEFEAEKARFQERQQIGEEKIIELSGIAREKYQLELSELPLPEENFELLEKTLQGMEDRLVRIGAVDPEVIAEYEEQKIGYETKLEQKEDLLASIRKLTTAIRELEEEADKRFRETYQTIETHFREVFPKLFPGGRAELRLEETEEDRLPGVEIMAYPPGKKFTRIELLSGGEKSLTATAFVLSIFLCNPSPFVLLDELDAPLDDTNLDLLGNVLREMNRQSQVIIITHNKQTMQLADRLYGVTMQEPGISSLFSIAPAEIQ